MPTLPQYNSQRNINAELAAPLRNEAAEPFQLQQQVIGALSEINQKWMEQKDLMQHTEAQTKYGVALADIQSRAATDLNSDNLPKYLAEIQQAKTASLGIIKNRAIANKAALEFDYQGQVAGIRIDSGFKQKELMHNREVLGTEASMLVREAIDAETPALKTEKQIKLTETLDAHAAKGTIAEYEKDEILAGAYLNAAAFDAEYNPDKFLEKVDEYQLSPEKKQELIADATNNKQKIKAEEIQAKKDIQTANAIEYTKSLLLPGAKPISIAEIIKAMGEGKVATEFAKAYQNAMTSPKLTNIDKELDDTKFTGYIMEVFASNDNDAIVAAITSTLDGGADGQVNQEEMKIILQMAIARNEEINNRGAEISAYGKSIGDRKEAQIYYAKGIAEGKKPEEAKREAIEKDNIKSNPNRTAFTVGQIIKNDNGVSLEVLRFDENGNPVFKKL